MGVAMKSKHLLILITILFFAGYSANLYANFANTYGCSAEGMARGGAMTATVNDWSSVFYNVGGLGRTVDLTGQTAGTGGEMTLKLRKTEGDADSKKEKYPSQFAISVLYTFPQLNLSIKRFGTDSGGNLFPVKTDAAKMDPYGFTVIGGVLDINTIVKMPDFISSFRLGIGMGMNADMSLVKVNDLDPRTHNFLCYGREIQNSVIMIGGGMGFMNDAFGGGVGVNVAFAGKGKMYMEAQLSASPQVPLGQSTMDLTVSPGAIAGIYFSPGKFASAIDGLDIGASYRQETQMKIDPFNAAAGILGGVINMNLMTAIQDYYSPHAISGGIAYSRWGLTLSADVNYEMWSKSTLGKVMKYHYVGIPKFMDTLSYRGGIKYTLPPIPLLTVDLMFGYAYVPTYLSKNAGTAMGIRLGPVSTQLASGMYNPMDNDKHEASFGIKFTIPKTWRLGGQFIIGLSYQFQYLMPKKVSKNGFSITDGTPDDMLETYMLNPSYSYGGMNHSVFMEVGMRL
jgi:hypothetical protein